MALRLEWGVDTANLIDSFGVNVDDGTDSGSITFTDDTHCHTDLSPITDAPISGGFTALDAALQADIRAVLATNDDAIVAYNAGSHTYTLDFQAATTTVDFRSATLGNDSGVNLARMLGFTADHANGSGSGHDCRLSGATSYTSNVRPYYLILPLIQGRSKVRPIYEQPELTMGASSDDGTFFYTSRDGAAKFSEWTQSMETGTPPSTFSDDGMPLFKHQATSAVPWSYEHAFEHARTGGSLPFLVVDGSDSIVYELSAEGTAMDPRRAASEDYDLWDIVFRAVRLGTV